MPQKRPKRLPTDFFDRLLSNQTDDQINDLLTTLVDEQITPTSDPEMELMPRGLPVPSVRAPQRRAVFHEKIEDTILSRDEELDELPLVGEQSSALDDLIPRSPQMQSAAGKFQNTQDKNSVAFSTPQAQPTKMKIPGLEDLEVPSELLQDWPRTHQGKNAPAAAKSGTPPTAWENETVFPPEVPLPPEMPAVPTMPAFPASSWESAHAPIAAAEPDALIRPAVLPDFSETFGVPSAVPLPSITPDKPSSLPPAPMAAPVHVMPSHAEKMRTRVKLRWESIKRKPKPPKLAKFTAPVSFAPPKRNMMEDILGEPQREKFQMTRYSRAALFFLLPAFIGFSFFSWYPMIKGLVLSFYHYSLTMESTFVGLDNYARAFQDELFWRTMIHAGGFCLLALLMGFWLPILISIFINELPLGKRPLKFIFFLPFLMPTVPAAILWKWIMDQGFGLLNATLASLGVANPHIGWLTNPNLALFSIALVYIWKNTGWAILIYSAALGNIDETLYEEAEINGASIWDKFKMVTLPAMRVVIAVMFIITIINTLQLFTEVYIMTNGGPMNSTEVIATYIYKQAFFYMDIGYASSLSMLLLLMLLFITAFRLRRLDAEGG